MPRIQGVGGQGGEGDGLSSKRFASLILAAGAGTRMGITKSLVMLGESTALEMAVGRLHEAQCGPITVVVGASHEDVMLRHRTLDVQWVVNERWEKGMFSSVRAGVGSFSELPDVLMLQLVDHCRVEVDTLKQLRLQALCSSDHLIRPTVAHRMGHPIIISQDILKAIIVADVSCSMRELLSQWKNKSFNIEFNDKFVTKDFDNVCDLRI